MEIKKDKIKICHLITQTHFGGAQKYICDIVNNLNNSFEITIVFGEGKKEDLQKYITNPQAKFQKIKFLGRSINIFKDTLAFFELFIFFLKNKFDILHLHSSKAGFIGALSAKLAGIKKIIYTVHGWVFKEDISQFKKNFYLFLEKISGHFKDKVICISKNDYNLTLKNKIVKESKLLLIYNGLKNNTVFLEKEKAREFFFSKIKNNNPNTFLEFDLSTLEIEDNNKSNTSNLKHIVLNEKTRIIGTISNLYPNKGIVYLIKSASKLNTVYNNLIFVVIGTGPEEAKLKHLVTQEKIPNFYFLGKIHQASRYLKAFDIFTLTSTKEGLPYSLLEALEAEISIVSSKLDSLSEIIENNQNGLFFESMNTEDLTYKIQSLLNNPNLVKKLKSQTKNSLNKFDFNEFISNIQSLYLN